MQNAFCMFHIIENDDFGLVSKLTKLHKTYSVNIVNAHDFSDAKPLNIQNEFTKIYSFKNNIFDVKMYPIFFPEITNGIFIDHKFSVHRRTNRVEYS